MKKPVLAFTLSFLLPGAGLWYLGKWKWGFLNLGVVLLIGAVIAFSLSDEMFERYHEYLRYVAVGLAAGSGALAQTIATQMNQNAKKDTQTQVDAPSAHS